MMGMFKQVSVVFGFSLAALVACAKTPPNIVTPPAALEMSASFQATAPQSVCAGQPITDCVFAAIWDAAQSLPDKKRDRIVPAFMSVVVLQSDAELTAAWQRKLGPAPEKKTYPDYSKTRAQTVLDESGWDGFIQRARASAPPFNAGRPEIMAAGVGLADDEQTATRLIEVMFDLAKPKTTRGGLGDTYEMSDFGHVLAELAVKQCDVAQFDRAMNLTNAPESLRYALWRARITGEAELLIDRIRDEAIEDDTRHVRSALEGVTPLVRDGYCPAG